MQHRQPSLLQLLVPNSASALSLQDKRKDQECSTCVLAPVAAAVAAPNEGTMSAMPLSRFEAATTTAAGVAVAGFISDGIAPLTGDAGKPPITPNARRRVLADERADEEDCSVETTASSRTTFSLVSRKCSTIYPPMTAAEGSVVSRSSDAGHTMSFNPVTSGAVAAALLPTAAPASVAASAGELVDAVACEAFTFATNFPSSSTTLPAVRSRRRSTRVNITSLPDVELEREREASPQPRAPPPRQRRATLAGPSVILEGAELESQTTDINDRDSDDYFVGDPAVVSILTSDGVMGASTSLKKGDGTPVSEYISNLFVSFDLGLCAAEGRTLSRVLSTAGSTFSSSRASSACPSPTSQQRRCTSLKMRSTTLAPVSNACSSTSSAAMPSSGTVGAGAGGDKRRFSHGFVSRAVTASTTTNADGGARRTSRITFLPDERLTDSPGVPSSNPTQVPASKVGEDHSSVIARVTSLSRDETLSARGSERVLGAAAVATGDDLGALTNTATRAATAYEAIVDVQPALNPPHAYANPLIDDYHHQQHCHNNNSDTSKTSCVLSSVLLDASTSTRRQHTSLPVAGLHGAEALTTNDFTLRSGDVGQKKSEDAGDAGSQEKTQNSNLSILPFFAGLNRNNNSVSLNSGSVDVCTPSLVTPQSDSLSLQGATPSFVNASLQLPVMHSKLANSLSASSASSVSDFSFAPDSFARHYGDRDEFQLRLGSEPQSSNSGHSFLKWTHGFVHAPFTGVSFLLTLFSQHVQKCKIPLSDFFKAAKRALLLPSMLVGVRKAPLDDDHLNDYKVNNNTTGAGVENAKPHPRVKLQSNPSEASFQFSPVLHDRLAASTIASCRTNPAVDGKIGVSGSAIFSETTRISFRLSRSPSPAAYELEAFACTPPPSQNAEGLQQILRETWNGAANAWFAANGQQEPRTALRSSARIHRNSAMNDESPLSPRVLSSPQWQQQQICSGSRGEVHSGGDCGVGLGDDWVMHSQRSTSPSLPHLSFVESCASGFEVMSTSDVFNRSTLVVTPRKLVTACDNGGLRRGSPFFEHCRNNFNQHASFSPQNRSGSGNNITTTTQQSALLDDEYREQLYREFEHPPSCCIGDLSGCFSAYKAMVETSSNGHHVLNWKELSLLLLPEDYIDYRDLFPPYHFVTFPDFVEFVEVLSVRYRR